MSYILGDSHFGVVTGDMDRSVEFYKTVLEFEEEFTVENPGVLIKMIKNGSSRIELVQPKGVEPPAPSPAVHFALYCSDIDAVLAKLKQFGMSAETETANLMKGFGAPARDMLVVFFNGPSGERIELNQLL